MLRGKWCRRQGPRGPVTISSPQEIRRKGVSKTRSDRAGVATWPQRPATQLHCNPACCSPRPGATRWCARPSCAVPTGIPRRRRGGVMKIASVAEVKARLSAYLQASATGPVVVTRRSAKSFVPTLHEREMPFYLWLRLVAAHKPLWLGIFAPCADSTEKTTVRSRGGQFISYGHLARHAWNLRAVRGFY